MAPDSEPKAADLVIRHGYVLTVNAADDVIADGAVAIHNGRIVAVGPTATIDAGWKGRAAIDAQGGVVRPGSIDAHIHVSQYTARSVLPRMGSGPVNMGHWKAELRPEDEHASAALAAIDYLRLRLHRIRRSRHDLRARCGGVASPTKPASGSG